MKKTCLTCGNEFNAIHRYNKYCNAVCFGISERGEKNPNWKGGKAGAVCMRCDKVFFFQKKKRNKGVFCSRFCMYRFNIETGRYRREKNPMWKGGAKTLSAFIRRSRENFVWRKEVFERDKYTCVLCGARNAVGVGYTVGIEADHFPIAFATLLEESMVTGDYTRFWDISNGRTLCLMCHNKTKLGRPKQKQT